MKKRILLAALSILAVTGASAQEKLETPSTKAGFVGLKFTQSSFTNWASGGENALALDASSLIRPIINTKNTYGKTVSNSITGSTKQAMHP